MGRKLHKQFLRLTHEIVRAIKQRPFTSAETCVLFAILEGTFGTWDHAKDEALDRNEFPLKVLARETGMNKTRVHGALMSLVADGIVIVYSPGTPRKPAVYGIDDHTQNWRRPTNLSFRQDGTKADRRDGTGKFRASGPLSFRCDGTPSFRADGPQSSATTESSVPSRRNKTREQSSMKSSIAAPLEVELTTLAVEGKTAAAKTITDPGPKDVYPRREVERLIAPLGCLVLNGVNRDCALRFFDLPMGTQVQKLAALKTAVDIKRPVLDANPGLRSRIIQYLFEEAAVQLGKLTAPTPPEPKTYVAAEGDEFDPELYYPKPTPAEPKTSTPLAKFNWSPRQPGTPTQDQTRGENNDG